MRSGTPIYILPMPTQVVYALYVAFCGIQSEPPGQNGLAHLYEHLSIRKYLLQLGCNLDEGCMINGFTKRQYTGYVFQADKRYAPQVLEGIGRLENMSARDGFSPKDVSNEKNKIRRENSQRDTIETRLIDKLMRTIFLKESYGNSIFCSEKCLDNLGKGALTNYAILVEQASRGLFLVGNPAFFPKETAYGKEVWQQNIPQLCFAEPKPPHMWEKGKHYAVGYVQEPFDGFREFLVASLSSSFLKMALLRWHGIHVGGEVKLYIDQAVSIFWMTDTQIDDIQNKTIQWTTLCRNVLNDSRFFEEFEKAKKLYLYQLLRTIDTPEYLAMYLFKTACLLHTLPEVDKILVDVHSVTAQEVRSMIARMLEKQIVYSVVL